MNSNLSFEHKDLFGYAVNTWHENKAADDRLIMERDDGERVSDRVSYYFYTGQNCLQDHLAQFSTYIYEPILDLGCGPGRCSCFFAEKEYHIIGIDISFGCLEICRETSSNRVKVAQMSINNLGFAANSFNTVLALGNNIGAAASLNGLERLLVDLHKMCKPSASFVITSVDVTQINDRKYQDYLSKKVEDGKDIGTITARLHYKGWVGKWFDWLFVSPSILSQLAHRTDWEIVSLENEPNRPYWYGAVLRRL